MAGRGHRGESPERGAPPPPFVLTMKEIMRHLVWPASRSRLNITLYINVYISYTIVICTVDRHTLSDDNCLNCSLSLLNSSWSSFCK